MDTTAKPLHIGRKVSRLRELRGIKQDALAFELGVSQQTVSRLEASENIDEEMLEKIATVLGVTVDSIKRFSEDAIFNIIGNTVTNHDNGALFNYAPSFNPLDKVVELYERLVQAEKDKVEMVERLLREK